MPKDLADRIIMFSVIGLVTWAIIGLPLVQSLQQPEPYNQQEPAKTEYQDNGAGQAVAKPIAKEQEAKRKQEGKWYSTFLEHTPDWFVAIFTGLLVYVTYRLVVSTNRLWQATKDAAERQVKDTEILQRAYVSVEPIGIHSLGGNKCTAHINICNVGNLPARNLSWAIKHIFSRDPRLNEFPVDKSESEGDNVISPGGQMIQGGGEIAVDEELLKKKSGWYLCIWGAVFYKDGFGNNRITRFCHRYNCENIRNVMESLGHISLIKGREIAAEFARYHRYGNDAD